jgi:type IV pilus assembly protein PilB
VIEEVLLQSGRLSEADLARARDLVAQQGGTLDEAVASLGLVTPDELTELVSSQLGVPCLGGSQPSRFDPQLKDLLPASVARKLRVVPVERVAKLLVAASDDPRRRSVHEELERLTGLEIQLLAALPSALLEGFKLVYGDQANDAGAAAAALPEPLRNISPQVLALVTAEVAQRFRAIPVGKEGNKLRVALADPDNQRTLRAMRFATEREVEPVAVPEDVLEAALAQYYGGAEQAQATEEQPPAAPPPPASPPPVPEPEVVIDPYAADEPASLELDLDAPQDASDGSELDGALDLLGLDAPEQEAASEEPSLQAPTPPPVAAPPRQDARDAPVELIEPTRLANIDRKLIALLSADAVRNYTALPVAKEDKTLVVAMENPGDSKAVRAMQYATGLLVRPVSVDVAALKRAIVRYYPPRVATGVTVEAPTIDPDVLDEVPDEVRTLLKPEIARRYKAVPVDKTDREVIVAMVNPADLGALQDLQFITGMAVTAHRIDEELLEPYLETFYVPEEVEEDQVASHVAEILEGTDEEELDSVEVVDQESDEVVTLSEEAAEEAPAVRIVNMLIKEALGRGGSDIHLESYEGRFRARVRVDGILYEVGRPPRHLRDAIISRVKVLAKLNISETRMPQDGRIKMRFKTAEGRIKDIDMRVSTTPTIWGEKVVMRLLDPDRLYLDLTKLGMEVEPLACFMRAVKKPYGMMLVVGPSGCGKTNTLYSAMSLMNSPETNIMTAEDPVEFNIKGINQVQVVEATGLNFAACLRSFLRQDPNIILVGEIRDYETAEIAVKASLTGHLVLSTLHTNDASGTISRMINMGVEPFLVSTAVLLIAAQRLVRCICPECIMDDERPIDELIDFGFTNEEAHEVQPKKGAGCRNCNGTGYKGRTGLFEVLEISDSIREIIMGGGTTLEIRRQAQTEGMDTLRQAGIHKVRQGVTSIAEVERETVL